MFKIGQVYNRRSEIHNIYKGQQYGGISTPIKHPYIFIFTSDAGEKYGYVDNFSPNGTFQYTGEGQENDMKMTKGNLAIHDHQKNNKEILLFESTSKSFVRFLGKCNYISHHIEERPDRNGKTRNAIIFHLDMINTQTILTAQIIKNNIVKAPKAIYIAGPTKRDSLQQLRDIALSSTPIQASIEEKLLSIRNRSNAIKLYAKKRANGMCEGCSKKAPFQTKSGPYLEVHHLTRIADGGADQPQNVIALCPTCHRKAHYSLNYLEFNNELISKVTDIESTLAK